MHKIMNSLKVRKDTSQKAAAGAAQWICEVKSLDVAES